MMAATLALGLLIGISLGALGGGGSILTVPALVYLIGQNPQEATTSSLIIVGLTALIGMAGHARSGHVRWSTGLAFAGAGVAASIVGTAVNRRVDPDVLLLAFAGLILLAAAAMLARTWHVPDAEARRPRALAGRASGEDRRAHTSVAQLPPPTGASTAGTWWQRAGAILASGLLVGLLTGLFGVGGGFLIVPALTLGLRMPMVEAVATSLLVITLNSATSLAARVGDAHADWAVIVPFTVAAIAGSLAGATVTDRVSGATLTRAFAGLLIAVATYTAVSSVAALT
jgi:uncharacterized membrane protein YfcA